MKIATRIRHTAQVSPARKQILAFFIAGSCAMATCAVWTPVQAQPFPNKPVRIILPVGAGNPGDVRARQIAAKFPEVFGQSLIVDNRPGGNGFIAAEAAARAPADGYTLFVGNSGTHVYNPWLFKKMPYRDVEDFAPVTMIAGGPLILAVNPQLPAGTLGELIALAKSKPGVLNYGSAGSFTDVLMHQIKTSTGINVVSVPYKTPGADLPDVMAGQIQITLNFWPILEPLVKAGKLRALAIAAPTRHPSSPDLPTFAEAGVPGIDLFAWTGLFVPAGTPPDIIDRLQKGVSQILQTPALREEIIRSGSTPGGTSTAEFAAFWLADRAKTGKSLAAAGILPE